MSYDPTEEQNVIINHDFCNHARILAGPGTGKSSTLLAFLNRILSENEQLNFALLTFTRAAASELGTHFSNISADLNNKPKTIHSFAMSILMQNSGISNFPEPIRIADSWEYGNIIRTSLRDNSGFSVRRIDKLFKELAANWQSLTEPNTSTFTPAERSRFLGAWNQHRRIYGYTLLAELPYALYLALNNHPDLNGIDYNLLIVDEYQDLNACDLDVIKQISDRGATIIAAGDDDQSIYSFRKAAPEGVRRFPSDYPGSSDYTLSISQRCGSEILNWANYIIAGDTSRASNRATLSPSSSSFLGEVGLLAFRGHVAEANGVANLVRNLVINEDIPPSEILILMRSDYNRMFSNLLRDKIEANDLTCFDPSTIIEILEDINNRKLIALLRLLSSSTDSLAWHTLLKLRHGIGDSFINYVYEKAKVTTTSFASELLILNEQGFPDCPRINTGGISTLINRIQSNISSIEIPPDYPIDGWGHWITDILIPTVQINISSEFEGLLRNIDGVIQSDNSLAHFVSQIEPLGKDIARSRSEGIRIMTMTASKGLTVRATVLVGLENEIIPRPNVDLSEERRILYVAMTRSREYLYGTWARYRHGPTARIGTPSSNRRNPTIDSPFCK